jgi:predicted RNase H-like nuclease (RuvC/YqgF family)
MNIFKAMKAKKKRAVDPNAPPRPNLMTHQVKIRDQDNSIIALTAEVNRLRERVESLQIKLNNQTNYLQALHNQFNNRNK